MSTTCSNWALSRPTSSSIRWATSRLRVTVLPSTPASERTTFEGSSTEPDGPRALGRDWCRRAGEHPVAPLGFELECHLRADVRPGVLTADVAVDPEAGEIVVERVDDRIEDGRLAGPGGPGYGEHAVASESGEVDLEPVGVGTERLDAEGEWPHGRAAAVRLDEGVGHESALGLRGCPVADLLEELEHDRLIGPLVDRGTDRTEIDDGTGVGVVVAEADGMREAPPEALHGLCLHGVVGEAGGHPAVGDALMGRVREEGLERSGERHHLAADGHRQRRHLRDLAAHDLHEADRLRVVLTEGVGEWRSRVRHGLRPSDPLGAVQVTERHVVESGEDGRIDLVRPADRQRALRVGQSGPGHVGVDHGDRCHAVQVDQALTSGIERVRQRTDWWVATRGIPSAAGAGVGATWGSRKGTATTATRSPSNSSSFGAAGTRSSAKTCTPPRD